LHANYLSMANVSDITAESTAEKSLTSMPQEGSRLKSDELIDKKLHAAQEILAEVFGISVAEAEEMIKQRSRERMLWPERFADDERADDHFDGFSDE